MGCPRTFCPSCDEEMIHRDNRKRTESASAFGQIVSRLKKKGYTGFTVGDIDLAVRRNSRHHHRTLLRVVEQKQPGHKFEEPQRLLLNDLDVIIRHAVHCQLDGLGDGAANLDEGSGVYVVRADIGEKHGLPQRATGFRSDVRIEGVDGSPVIESMSARAALTWLVHVDGMADIVWDPERGLWKPEAA